MTSQPIGDYPEGNLNKMKVATKTTKRKAKPTETADPVAELQSKAKDDSDVDEDCQVADLSSIPAPQIEFEMPSLIPMDEKKNVSAKKEKSAIQQKQLTANSLNNEIVKLRVPVAQARVFVTQQILRRKHLLEKRIEKAKTAKLDKLKRKVERCTEELAVLKDIPKVEVSKFALLNTKSKDELNITDSTPTAERCLYRLTAASPMAKSVELFRATYPDWESRITYLLQRLGLQYAGTKSTVKKESKKTEQKEVTKAISVVKEDLENEEEESAEGESEEEDVDGEESEEAAEESDVIDEEEGEGDEESADGETEDDEEYSDVEMGTDSEDDTEMAEKRRKMLLDLAGITEDTSRPKPTPKRKAAISESDEDRDPTGEGPVGKKKKKVLTKKGGKTAKTESVTKSEKAASTSKGAAKPLKAISEETRAETLSVVQNLLEKSLRQHPVSKKMAKKIKSAQKEAAAEILSKAAATIKPIEKVPVASKTVVQKVALSAGGRIKVGTVPTDSKKDDVINSGRKPTDEREPADSDGSDSDDNEPPVSSFFLAADGSSRGTNKKVDSTSGEESVDDDEDMAVQPVPKKGGEMRKMSSVRERFQLKQEQREMGRGVRSTGNMNKGGGRTAGKKGVSAGVPTELHPSWAARRQAKEQQAAKPMGQKTVFADD